MYSYVHYKMIPEGQRETMLFREEAILLRPRQWRGRCFGGRQYRAVHIHSPAEGVHTVGR